LARIFYPSSEKLRFLLESIHQREVALPDFQRDFVWDPRATEELIESILQNYPAGSLLRIKNKSGFLFAPREVAGAPALDGHSPSYLVLDGQQRLTALYQALYGRGNHRYFMNLRGLLDGKDLDDCVFYLRKRRAKSRFGTIEKQAAELVFPLEIVFGDSNGFEEWLDQVLSLRPAEGNGRKELKQKLRDLRKAWIHNIEDYEFPVVTLSEETEAEAVCTIFETLNRTGVKLSVFDLLAARFWPENVRLRDRWEDARNQYSILGEFDVDPYYILQAIAIFTARAAPSCKRGDVLKMEVGQIQAGWEPVVRGVADMLQMLRDDCGVVLPGWLPYNPILIPAGAVLAKHEDATGPQVGALRDKMRRWFWCSVFGQAYENAPNSQAVKDAAELTTWFGGGREPDSVRNFSFEPDVLRETTVRQRALYRGCIALILRSEARDFHSGNRITASMVHEKKIDDHHVFPRGHLANSGEDVAATLRDCVLNRTLIDKETNIRIGKRAPAVYLAEIEGEIGADRLNRILQSHLLPVGSASSLRQDRFFDFLVERQQRFAQRIEEVTK
jgi:hypothetical protein